jgi:hypothetical protein
LSVISTGSFFSGVMREYSSLAWPGATVEATSSILSISPVSIAAMRAGEGRGGGEGEFHEMPLCINDDRSQVVIARRKATKQSIAPRAAAWIASLRSQ